MSNTNSILFKNARFKPYRTIGFNVEVQKVFFYKESLKSKPVRSKLEKYKAKLRKAKLRKAKKMQTVKWV